MKSQSTKNEARASTFKVFAIFFGTIIGAGFASGREVYIYFARFGGWGILSTFLAGILFYFLGLMFLKLGRKVRAESLGDFMSLAFGKFSKFVEIVVAISYVIVIAAMFAGFDSIQKILFSGLGNFPLLQIISVILCVLITFGGLKNISKINFVLLPAIILFILIIFIASVRTQEQSIAFVVFNDSILSLISPLVCTMIFVCSNMFLTGFILMKTGVNSDDKTDKRACLLTGITIFLITFFACFSIALNPGCVNFDMPFLLLAFKVSDAFVVFSVIVLWFAIFTSSVATLYTLSWWLNSYLKHPKLCTIICATSSYLLSKIGFSFIIDTIYPLTGFIDVVFVLSFIYLYFKIQKKNIKALKNNSFLQKIIKNREKIKEQ